MSTKNKIVTAALVGMMASSFVSFSANAASEEGHCHGVNACKGKGACKTDSNDCKGKNGCDKKGWVKMTKADCEHKKGKFEEAKAE